jgi:hypothetical protein
LFGGGGTFCVALFANFGGFFFCFAFGAFFGLAGSFGFGADAFFFCLAG